MYDVPVMQSRHPELTDYIVECCNGIRSFLHQKVWSSDYQAIQLDNFSAYLCSVTTNYLHSRKGTIEEVNVEILSSSDGELFERYSFDVKSICLITK